MSDVLLVCVSEDVGVAEALAEVFDAHGFSIEDDPDADPSLPSVGAGVLILSQASIKSPHFRQAAQGAISAGKAVVVNLSKAPPPPVVGGSPIFNLWGWNGDPDDPVLNQLAQAVSRLVGATPVKEQDTVPVQQARVAATAAAPVIVAKPAPQPQVQPQAKKAPPPAPTPPPKQRARVQRSSDAPGPAPIPFRVSRPGRMRAILTTLLIGVIISGAMAAGVVYFGRQLNLAGVERATPTAARVAEVTPIEAHSPVDPTPLSAAIAPPAFETIPPAEVVNQPIPHPRAGPPADAPRVTHAAAPSVRPPAPTVRQTAVAAATTPTVTRPAVTRPAVRRTPTRRVAERTPTPSTNWNTAIPATPAPSRGPPE